MRAGTHVFIAPLGLALILCAAQPLFPDVPATLPGADMQPLLARLASDSFVEREAAQKELEKISPEHYLALRKLADMQSDPEIKARLSRRADEMELFTALHPPPLALHLER